ncbi:MAG: hypothetical protein WC378_01050 [Opitutaceae bacterium]|jgi:lipopolysaccharide export system protein LptC
MNTKNSHPIRRAYNAFVMLAKRSIEIGQPGLTLWTDAGQRAVGEAKSRVEVKAATAEKEDNRALTILDHVLADGRVTPEEIHTLKHARRHVANSAKTDAEMREVVA